MQHRKTGVIPIDFATDLDNTIGNSAKVDFLKNFDVHLIHVVNSKTEDIGDQELKRAEIINSLHSIKDAFLYPLNEDQVTYHCIFSDETNESICDYITRTYADLAIIPSRDKEGKINRKNQLGKYLMEHCPASVLIIH